jgi:hypothetical protein
MVSGPTLFRLLTETVLPSSAFASLIGLPFFVSTASHASSSLAAPLTPEATIWTGSFFDEAMMSDVTFEKPICRSPLTVWAVIVAPPSAICGWIVRFSSLKKPCLMPT